MTQMTNYREDFAQWAKEQAHLLRSGQLTEIDFINLADEIDAMSKSEQRELRNRLIVLIQHLLKRQYQPTHDGVSWQRTIFEQREAISDLIDDSPSLKNYFENTEWFEKCWTSATKKASIETGFSIETFPKKPIWTINEILAIQN